MSPENEMVDPANLHMDWDDQEMVRNEIDRVFKTFPYLNECAAADGGKCPICGSSDLTILDKGRLHPKHFMVFHCRDCGRGYTRYQMDPEHEEKWGPFRHSSVVSFQIDHYSHYLYFKPGSHVFEGIGPGVFPWSR